jgi:hypothetical protein
MADIIVDNFCKWYYNIYIQEESTMNKYTIWVGGVEITDHYVDSVADAEQIAKHWQDQGYDDVFIGRYYDNEL